MFKNIVLGAVQGLTEFFPVSSSGHLVIFKNFFGMTEPRIYIEIFLHTGTLLAVAVIFYREIVDILKGFLSTFGIFKGGLKYKKAAWLLIVANIPAGIAGILFKSRIERIFAADYIVFILLITTGFVLFAGKYFKKELYDIKDMGWVRAVIIGISQAVAILPGISRSGLTITAGFASGLKKSEAANFSFLMMIPAVAGATLLELKDISVATINAKELAAGVLTSFIVGYISLKLLLALVKNYKLHYFAYYCWAAGILGLAGKILL